MHYAGIRKDPRANANPLRSMPLLRPASAVFGPSPLQAATAVLTSARIELTMMEGYFARSCATLGDANRAKPSLRRGRQAKAMRQLNRARADLRRARKAVAAAEAALLALDGDLFRDVA